MDHSTTDHIDHAPGLHQSSLAATKAGSSVLMTYEVPVQARPAPPTKSAKVFGNFFDGSKDEQLEVKPKPMPVKRGLKRFSMSGSKILMQLRVQRMTKYSQLLGHLQKLTDNKIGHKKTVKFKSRSDEVLAESLPMLKQAAFALK